MDGASDSSVISPTIWTARSVSVVSSPKVDRYVLPEGEAWRQRERKKGDYAGIGREAPQTRRRCLSSGLPRYCLRQRQCLRCLAVHCPL
jgi:hypothetical protein